MKIGIIIHSQTGNTNLVAQKLRDELRISGHWVNIEKLKVVGELRPGAKDIQFEKVPALNQYDAIIFGSPVQAFSLSPVMKSYLDNITSLNSKKVVFLLTQFFPYPWMGGNHAIRQMKKICESKGAVVCGTAIINWSRPSRAKKIISSVGKISSLF